MEYASWGPRLEDLLRNSALTMIENQGYTLVHRHSGHEG